MYNEMSKYTFIHPTKTGGTSVELFFKEHYSDYIVGEGHGNICTNENNPIIIVRDVKSRFFSMYKYWKNGAKDTKFKRSRKWIEEHKNVTILDFIHMLKSKKRKEQLYSGFTWDQHFDNITKWIKPNTNFKNIIIIRYEKNLNQKIQTLINRLGIKNKNVILPVSNVSLDTNCVEIDNKEVKEFISEYFKDDIEFIRRINSNPHAFKLVI